MMFNRDFPIFQDTLYIVSRFLIFEPIQDLQPLNKYNQNIMKHKSTSLEIIIYVQNTKTDDGGRKLQRCLSRDSVKVCV